MPRTGLTHWVLGYLATMHMILVLLLFHLLLVTAQYCGLTWGTTSQLETNQTLVQHFVNVLGKEEK